MEHRQALIAIGLVAIASPRATADTPAPIQVTPPTAVAGDGRSVAPIEVTGTLPKVGKELPVPEVPVVHCQGAAGLAAIGDGTPAVLAPTVTRPTKLACKAKLRDTEVPFSLVVKPPGAGLYAATIWPTPTDVAAIVRSTVPRVELDAFWWDGSKRSAPTALRAAASQGKLTTTGGKLVLELRGNAPRTIAIALADGGHLGAAFVPVTGVTTVPIESNRGAKVEAWIAGTWFGPVKTRGRFAKVPIEVPPGVTKGVARSKGREGYVTDAITDLKVPMWPRIAATAPATGVPAGQSIPIAIAVTGRDGRPGSRELPVTATAKRGAIADVRAAGGGLWTARYTAPTSAGPDRIAFRIDDDRTATGELALDVTPGGAARIELDVPPGPYHPGGNITGTVRVFDGTNNPVRDAAVTATLGGAPLEVTPGDPIAFRGKVPEHLPDSGQLELDIAVGATHERTKIAAGGDAESAAIEPVVDGRRAVAKLSVRDHFGNLVPDGAFDVQITGAHLVELHRGSGTFEATLSAPPHGSDARVVVVAHERVLAERRFRFESTSERDRARCIRDRRLRRQPRCARQPARECGDRRAAGPRRSRGRGAGRRRGVDVLRHHAGHDRRCRSNRRSNDPCTRAVRGAACADPVVAPVRGRARRWHRADPRRGHARPAGAIRRRIRRDRARLPRASPARCPDRSGPGVPRCGLRSGETLRRCGGRSYRRLRDARGI